VNLKAGDLVRGSAFFYRFLSSVFQMDPEGSIIPPMAMTPVTMAPIWTRVVAVSVRPPIIPWSIISGTVIIPWVIAGTVKDRSWNTDTHMNTCLRLRLGHQDHGECSEQYQNKFSHILETTDDLNSGMVTCPTAKVGSCQNDRQHTKSHRIQTFR
jgi:hypothetical protein